MTNLLIILNALIDTAEQTTELNAVYNSKNNTSVSWSEVYKLQNQLETNSSKIYAEWTDHRYFLCKLLDRLQDDWDYTECVVPQAKDLLTFLDDILKDYK